MNTKLPSFSSQRAFTLTEVMVSASLMMMVMAGIIGANIFGLRMMQITRAKLGANDEARKAIGKLVSEVRSAKLVKIGTGSLSTFTEVDVDTLQKGSALQLYTIDDNTNQFIRYFWDSSDNRLKRTTNGASSVAVIASYITNSLIFSCEDYKGNVLTNNENNRVVALTLQFFQIEFPVVLVGPGRHFDFYQLRTKITRRKTGY